MTADHVIYAGYGAMLPYICGELSVAQRSAVSQQVRAPLVYVNVVIRNWHAWVRQGVHYVNNPTGFYSQIKLDYPVSLGDYRFPVSPDQPIVVHLVHVPWPDDSRGDLRMSWRAARTRLYAMNFAEFEEGVRSELSRILGPGGFDADRDIEAITVNRWGHGYAFELDPLHDPPEFEISTRLASAVLGRIHFAGTDAAWTAYADRAIDSAARAVGEISGTTTPM